MSLKMQQLTQRTIKGKNKMKQKQTGVRPIRKKYSHAIANEHKEQKRKEAEVRQIIRSKRTNAQQLAKLNAGGFVVKNERARLGG